MNALALKQAAKQAKELEKDIAIENALNALRAFRHNQLVRIAYNNWQRGDHACNTNEEHNLALIAIEADNALADLSQFKFDSTTPAE
jgi:hypothetical protein